MMKGLLIFNYRLSNRLEICSLKKGNIYFSEISFSFAKPSP